MIVQGSLNYSPSGRKRKTIRTRKKKPVFKEMKARTVDKVQRYQSVVPTACSTSKVEHPKLEGYTVAIPYNKGAYQVIPNSDIKYIGK